MADRTVYIVGLNQKYLTNKTNATRLWEIVERELGSVELEISYQKGEEDTHYTTTPARKGKIKQLCIDAIRNRILIHPVGADLDMDMEECISVQQDIFGGRD